ncbi:uncharacterized protein LOC131156463 [Malania oleifera]|uniref:uncharacterized protein LOC131156463 n=1 Tax=Malania oleifera TaxID=397392 RepID=UPI0025AE0417|nr:uncharacterized protein LOC131156463 [Malania oleifera]
MKQMEVENVGGGVKAGSPPPPPPPPPLPPLPKFWVAKKPVVKSVTNQEIAQFWRQRHMDEEDHLLAAIKAAARIRAQNLKEDDYRHFEEFLKDYDISGKNSVTATTNCCSKKDELHVGIKDWWTKSKYAYLNQPTIESMDIPKRRTITYIPNFCFCRPPPPRSASLGIF